MNRFSKITLLLAASFFFLSILVLGGCTQASKGGKVAAEVNGTKIYASEVDRQLKAVMGVHGDQFQGEEGKKRIEAFRKQTLDNLIDNELIIQQSKKEGFKVTKTEVKKKIDEIKKAYPSEEAFRAELAQSGLKESDVPIQVERLLYAEKVIGKLFEKLKVSDTEISEFYEKNKKTFETPATVNFDHIFSREEATATTALKAIKKGLSFDDAVLKYSEDLTTKQNKGNIGTQTASSLEQVFGKEFTDAVFGFKAGEVANRVVKSTQGFHVLRLVTKQDASLKTLEEVRDQIKNQLISEKQRSTYESWIKEIRSRAKIKKYI